jgi:fused signal recognition particle receptor
MTATAEKKGLISRLRERLNKGDSWLTRDLGDLLPGKAIDDEILEELETRLLMADVGVAATTRLMDGLAARVKRRELMDQQALLDALRDGMEEILAPFAAPLTIPGTPRPYVILMVGVNGVGKTTTIGKLARRFSDQGLKVMLASGDTFRAAATEQLQKWGERNDVPVIAQGHGADPAAVVFDALQSAQARGIDVLIADTAGRLHTQAHLMDELRKIKRVLGRRDDTAPHEVMLVVDGGTGQNALAQARQFNQAVGVTGITVTKLDGTARGGILFAIAEELGVPIRFIGLGEQAGDLVDFDAGAFVSAIVGEPTEESR